MGYKDKEIQALIRRAGMRSKRHGNWRQIVIDCGGICVRCSSSGYLEFHECFGEDHNGDGRMQQRILLCPDCHQDHHPNNYNVCSNPKKSKLMDDVNAEIRRCGSYSLWLAYYMLDDSTWGTLIGKREDLSE